MGILDKQSKAMLVESMRNSLCNVLAESTNMTAKDASNHMKFVNENATYEQLLNITMNPLRESKYLPDYVLEGAVAVLHRACMTGRKNIGPNAITEGALKLHKETGAVITESMLDAALESVKNGRGLEIVGNVIREQMEIMNKMSKKTVTESATKKEVVTESATKKEEPKKEVVTEACKCKKGKKACKCGKKNCKCK